ncbi:MAG: sugar ABC transporter permease [Clostridiales bacterium]|jgi:putative aldouronate transport system permease protein|nr:sugar ABC transporter permease [Clostridiales bacterium]
MDASSDLARRFKKYRVLYLFLLPGFVILVLFAYLPMLGSIMAFQQFDPVSGFLGSPWVGFRNFERVFSSPVFGRALRNTIVISLLKLAFGFTMPILFALLINELRGLRFKKGLQTAIYLPNFVSWVIAAGIWYSLLGENGIVNDLLTRFGIIQQPHLFMQDTGLFYPIIIFTDLWKNLGYNTIFYMAAMATIPMENYEAAMIDGAGRFQQALYITLPGLAKTIMLLLILQAGGLLNAGFDQMWTMSNLAVREIADILDTAVLRTLTSGTVGDLSIGAALGLFKSVVALGLFTFTNWLSSKLSQDSLV